jgi:CSLREA domain-containing protein
MSERAIRRNRERDLARRERRRARRAKLATAAAIGVAGAIAVPAQAQAGTFTVTTLADENGTGAETSLREAIVSANNNPGANTITFAPSLSGDITLTHGQLYLYGNDLDIQGPGADQINVDGNGASRDFHIYNDGEVSISGLTVTGGKASGGYRGGAITVYASSPTSSLTITDSTISGNSTAGYGGTGGAISDSQAPLTITGSTISGNSTAGVYASGGGIYANTRSLTITDSTISGNSTAGYGSFGGGIDANGGSLTITDSTISGNSTTDQYSPGGGIYDNDSSLAMTGSTISGNSTSYGQGGGISSAYSPLSIANSTISGNSASGNHAGGGIFSRGPLTVDSATIADNDATVGGGISSVGSMTLTNTIVADNTADVGYNDFFGNGGGPFTLTASLLEDPSGATYTADSASIIGKDPQLLPLADNGGPTETQAIPKTSPAFDSGATDQAKDQRGVDRPQYSADDMGAFELEAAAPPPPTPPPPTPPDPTKPVDTTPPDTTIKLNTAVTKGRHHASHKSHVKFKFSSDEPGATFECALSGPEANDPLADFAPCSSPKHYKHLEPGKYTFRMRAIDAAGNADQTPAEFGFELRG